jgi:hypothetical protein
MFVHRNAQACRYRSAPNSGVAPPPISGPLKNKKTIKVSPFWEH